MRLALQSLLACAVVAASALAACSSTPATIPVTGTDISVFPTKLYVGVDDSGKAIGSAPVSLVGGSGVVTWTSATTGVATATGNAKTGTVTGVKAGSSVVTVKSGTKTAAVTVTVIQYPAADIAKGQTEYTTLKCDDCHNVSGSDITPSDIGQHTDAEIMGPITTGVKSEGPTIAVPHKFTVTAAIIAYMRSVPARSDAPKADGP